MLPSLRRAPASRHRGAALLIGGVGSLEQICVSGVFDLKPSQLWWRWGEEADYRLLCFSNSFPPHFPSHSSSFGPRKTHPAPPFFFLSLPALFFTFPPFLRRRNPQIRSALVETAGRVPRRCDDSLRWRHYNCRRLLFPPPRRCVPLWSCGLYSRWQRL